MRDIFVRRERERVREPTLSIRSDSRPFLFCITMEDAGSQEVELYYEFCKKVEED